MFILQIRYHHTYQESAINRLDLQCKNDTSQLEPPFLCMAQQHLVGQGLLIIEASRSHSVTPHSVGLFGGVVSPSQRLNYLTTQKTHEGQTSMHPAGFWPVIPASQRPQTHALDRAVAGSGLEHSYDRKFQRKTEWLGCVLLQFENVLTTKLPKRDKAESFHHI